MYYNIYQETVDREKELVQSDLSPGEARQVILDHIKNDMINVSEDIIQQHIQYIENLIHNIPLHTSEDLLHYFEDLIYDAVSDEVLAGTRWEFNDHTILVEESA